MTTIRWKKLLVVAALVACAPITDDTARKRTLELMPTATIGSIRANGDDKVVMVTMPGGGLIEVEFESDATLEALSADAGPFDYQIAVPNALSFSDARDRALAAKPGELEAWRYNSETSSWDFYVRAPDAQLFLVALDAKSGETRSIAAKTKVE